VIGTYDGEHLRNDGVPGGVGSPLQGFTERI
jgi:hypothetical protein